MWSSVSPPLALENCVSDPSTTEKFSLFSGVIADGLCTATVAAYPQSALSGPILSEADDCVVLVFSSQ